MASILRFLFLSLILHSILLVRCQDEEDNLLRGINQYRTSLNLANLIENDRAECLADEVADTFNNRPCPSNSRPDTLPQVSDYINLLTRCTLNPNTTQGWQILPVCVPSLQQGTVLSNYTNSEYVRFINDTRFSGIGIGSEDDWIVVVLAANASSSGGNNSDEEDGLLQGINQYRTSLNLTTLVENDRAECLADEIADTFKNQPCPNTSRPDTLPRVSDYPNLLTRCRLNPNTTQDGQILPVCVHRLQRGSVLSNYTNSEYARYINDTRFSGVGIGSEDNWTVVVLTANTPNGSFLPGNGVPAGHIGVSPFMFLLIGLFASV